MRASNIENQSLSTRAYRLLLTMDENFTFGHYQIGADLFLKDGELCGNSNVGYATIGGVRIGNRLFYSVAMCSPVDNFSRKEGRLRVIKHMRDTEYSNKRGILDISHIADEQPAIVLKYALEKYLSGCRNLPPWTRQNVFFKNMQECSVDVAGNRHQNNFHKRRAAALKAWETRRKINNF